ncbi:hypothetical protein [Entomomonas moraniae]|uniref:hypothetical protein n=1 Tax=Entomomonas moraniae TaxID=2213226 RepID=UPI0013DF6C95|nr:hypothetical protein [Entomomonas moraniae]
MSNDLLSAINRLIEAQQALTESIRDNTQSNRELIEALLSEEDTEESITTYMDGTPI